MEYHFPGVVGGGAGAARVIVEVLVGGVAAAVPQQVRLVAAVAASATTGSVPISGLQKYARELKNAGRKTNQRRGTLQRGRLWPKLPDGKI